MAGENVIYSKSNILSAKKNTAFYPLSHLTVTAPLEKQGEPWGDSYNVTYRKEHSHEENNISDTGGAAARITADRLRERGASGTRDDRTAADDER